MTSNGNKNQFSREEIEQRLLSDPTILFRTMFERSGTAKAILNKEGIIVMANETLARLVDLSVRDIEGKHSWFEFVAEHDRRKAQEYHNLRRSHPGLAPERYEFILTDRNGAGHDIEINVAVFPGTDLSLLSMVEVTHLKTAQEMGRLTRFAVENAGEAIFWLDAKGAILYANGAATRMFGYNIGVLMSKSIQDLDAVTAKRDWKKKLADLKQTDSLVWNTEYRRNDGRVLPVEVLLSFIQLGDKGYYWAFIRDVSERVEAAEREKQLQSELNLSGRLASVGELAAGVAHEINNPLTGIIGFSERLLRKSSDEKMTTDLKRIHSEAQRAAKVVQNLLTFARQREPRKEPVDVNEILAESLELREYELKQLGIQVVTHFADLPGISADYYQLEQVFVNLIINAEQAITTSGKGDRLNISSGEMDGYIVVTVADNGPGIKPRDLKKVFDPFFTTRGDEGGTGLGLSICHGIIEEHGGRISVASEPGEGTTFTISLPLETEADRASEG
ncbi:MAG: PAS domain S-box protein [Dehalogenimonas sp.]|uniref:histidine kinase n=1 Tax=Candidatus Dehalogenimonas loeffleri TaxID=3127115 RepID=A0ABZ2J1S0_9CHLR|nr:PAS domain S-box protein [Dehalogenimonas sp.]